MTKASKARRQCRFERRGRLPGSYKSLFEDHQRFCIAGWLTFEPIFGPHRAARLALVWFEERTPITLKLIGGLLRTISVSYAPPKSDKVNYTPDCPKASRSRDLDDYARLLQRKARLMTGRATTDESKWLKYSSDLLHALITFAMEGNITGVGLAIKVLRQIGWGETLDRIGNRLAPDVLANFPPLEGPLLILAQRLLTILRERKNLTQKT